MTTSTENVHEKMDESVKWMDEIAGRFVDSLKGNEPAPIVLGAAFNLIGLVLCHLPPSDWAEAADSMNAATALALEQMRDGDSEAETFH
jgi:hypothetical protein